MAGPCVGQNFTTMSSRCGRLEETACTLTAQQQQLALAFIRPSRGGASIHWSVCRLYAGISGLEIGGSFSSSSSNWFGVASRSEGEEGGVGLLSTAVCLDQPCHWRFTLRRPRTLSLSIAESAAAEAKPTHQIFTRPFRSGGGLQQRDEGQGSLHACC